MGKTAIIGIIVVIILLAGGFLFVKNKNQQKMMTQNEVTAKPTESVTNPAGKDTTGNGTITMMATSSKFGQIVTASNGMSLYVFDKDTAGKSNCTGVCATEWPAYTQTGTAPSSLPAHLGTITRDDGKVQYTWDGKPVYFYVGDKAAGDTNGDGYDNLWHIAK